jgi:hypothetical protein
MKLYSSGINPSSSSGTNVASSLIVIHVFFIVCVCKFCLLYYYHSKYC